MPSQKVISWSSSLLLLVLAIVSPKVCCQEFSVRGIDASLYPANTSYCDIFQPGITASIIPVPLTISNGSIIQETQSNCVKVYAYRIGSYVYDSVSAIHIELTGLVSPDKRDIYPVLAWRTGSFPEVYSNGQSWSWLWNYYDKNGK